MSSFTGETKSSSTSENVTTSTFYTNKLPPSMNLPNDTFDKSADLTKKGIERITELGKMSVYDYPWDGMFPINQFVRWVSTF